jgi:hypothetical protein
MGVFDIFSTSFLFSIAIILLICGGMFTYFSYKIDKQDHKLTSMVNLVSILAEDLQFVKNNQLNTNVSKVQTINSVNSDLISVSDGGDGENYDDEEDEEDEDEDDDEDDDDEENNIYSIDEEELQKYPFKNISLTNETSIKENNHLFDEIKTIHLENPISFEETNVSLSNSTHNDLQVTSDDISFLKNVTMPDFENSENTEDLQGSYKKMSINKLREVIVSKGVVLDASKLKKNEILKMLEIDN